ncbi:MAG: ABC transporter substrate-binding protein [Saprospiraceae bacterium]|nr:ABC transporter substrate-binding protein [Saprospiraceae bacterium]
MTWLDPNNLRKTSIKRAKIVCLVPSLTELLLDGGLLGQVVGRTKFCVHPKKLIKTIPVVGGTKNVNTQKLFSLQPDLVIANKEENTQSDIEVISQYVPVYLTDIKTLDDIIVCIKELMVYISEFKGADIVNEIKGLSIDGIFSSEKVAYLIWNDPIMVVGNDTFIHYLLTKAGLKNVFSEINRYPEVSQRDLIDKNPDYLFLSSEPYPFKAGHLKHYEEILPHTKVILVDGEMFSWYGTRILKAPDYFLQLKKTLC